MPKYRPYTLRLAKRGLKAIKDEFLSRKRGSVRAYLKYQTETMDPLFWKKHLKTEKPRPEEVLGLIKFVRHFDGQFDYSFPGFRSYTDDVLCVMFFSNGKIDISIQS